MNLAVRSFLSTQPVAANRLFDESEIPGLIQAALETAERQVPPHDDEAWRKQLVSLAAAKALIKAKETRLVRG